MHALFVAVHVNARQIPGANAKGRVDKSQHIPAGQVKPKSTSQMGEKVDNKSLSDPVPFMTS